MASLPVRITGGSMSARRCRSFDFIPCPQCGLCHFCVNPSLRGFCVPPRGVRRFVVRCPAPRVLRPIKLSAASLSARIAGSMLPRVPLAKNSGLVACRRFSADVFAASPNHRRGDVRAQMPLIRLHPLPQCCLCHFCVNPPLRGFCVPPRGVRRLVVRYPAPRVLRPIKLSAASLSARIAGSMLPRVLLVKTEG